MNADCGMHNATSVLTAWLPKFEMLNLSDECVLQQPVRSVETLSHPGILMKR